MFWLWKMWMRLKWWVGDKFEDTSDDVPMHEATFFMEDPGACWGLPCRRANGILIWTTSNSMGWIMSAMKQYGAAPDSGWVCMKVGDV